MAIPDGILLKPGELTPEERLLIQKHPVYAYEMLSPIKFLIPALDIPYCHHERWDGSGYPGHVDVLTGKPLPGYETEFGLAVGKKGEEIPLFGRIVAVADVYDALTSRRAYKEPWDEGRVLEEIHALSGKSFDPEIVKAFFSCLDALKTLAKRYPDQNGHGSAISDHLSVSGKQ